MNLNEKVDELIPVAAWFMVPIVGLFIIFVFIPYAGVCWIREKIRGLIK